MSEPTRTRVPQPQALEVAISLATISHSGQLDKGGLPYILHPLSVMLSLPPDDWEGRIVAVLHDVIEDTECTLADLREDFEPVIVEAVDAISKRAGETNRAYWARCNANPIARRVKLADMADNTRLDRLRVLSYEQQQYLSKKYDEARKFFAEKPS